MIQLPLEVYRIDMKYIRNLHNIDDRVFSVSPQTRKDERPFLGVILVCNEHKYCVPLSKPKKKHEKMRDKIDFKKMDTRRKKELLIKELEWCNNHISDLVNTANVLYQKYISGEKFAARKQCLDFKKMELECNKYNSKMQNPPKK